ncbi:MAG TPA: metal-sensitive transcriptional regulator [Candidatus Kaiserbacteria bacterium]|nr:metal-sensitive transcriptional regulator [Candidatus Kaiserbacteria bacterium]
MQQQVKRRLIHRLKIAEGQVRGVQKMITDGEYCIDIIAQTSAVRHALAALEDIILEEHLSKCVVDQIKSGDHKKAIKEILSVYYKKNKK